MGMLEGWWWWDVGRCVHFVSFSTSVTGCQRTSARIRQTMVYDCSCALGIVLRMTECR